MSRWRKDPLEICGGKHANATMAYHECLCSYDYRNQRSYRPLKFKHCLLADEMRRIDNFELYVIIAVVVGVVVIFGIAAFCSCKWYLQTNSNPCGCLSCCKKKKKRKKEEVDLAHETPPMSLELDNGGQVWTPMRLANKDIDNGSPVPSHDPPKEEEGRRSGLCMNFCLSDPVQDCCEFFDCDIMWRKKSIYTIPIFGRRKQAPLQRRPTRPAPPPPKPAIPPVVKYPEPVIEGYEDELDCEPIPEAPPSPEPIRTDQPRAMYVDPLSFLQRPFLKTSKDKAADDEPDALYSKVKEFVFGKSKKSGSVVSLNKLGISKSPDGVSTTSSKKSKYGRTGSLASLHNLSDEQLDISYHNKRSMSLASLHMVEEEPSRIVPKGAGSKLFVTRSRGSLHNICEDDDGQPYLKTDEYIDLEEMSKRIEAKMLAAQGTTAKPNHVEVVPVAAACVNKHPGTSSMPAPVRPNWTPNFIPASAYTTPPKYEDVVSPNPAASPTTSHVPVSVVAALDGTSHHGPSQPYLSPDAQYGTSPIRYGGDAASNYYYPPVPATPEKPAVPARIAVGTPVASTGTLSRPKPVVPPRPPNSGGNSPQPRGANSPRTHGANYPRTHGANSPRTHGANSPRLYGGASPRSHGGASPRSHGGTSPRSHSGNSPKPRAPQPPTMGRHPHVMKPTAPPPPPPVTAPIESSL